MKHKKKITKFIVFVTILSLLVAIVPFGSNNNIAKADAHSVLYFDPSSTSTSLNSDVATLTAKIVPNGNSIVTVSIYVQFDSSRLSFSSASCSAAGGFPVSLITNEDETHYTKVNDNVYQIDCSVPTATPIVPVTTDSAVATFSFHALSSTVVDSDILFVSPSGAGDINNPDDNSLLLESSTGATVTITTEITAIGAISGTTRVGETLTAGALTPSGATVNYQWQRADSADGSYTNINGATANTYSLTSDDQNKFIKVVATGAGSYTGSVTSVATSAVSGENSSSSSSHKNKKKSTPKRYISQSKKSISRGATLVQRGKKFTKNGAVLLYFSKPGGGYYAPMKIKADKTGKFSVKYVVTKPKGSYSWYAFDVKTNKKSKIKTYKVK